VLDVAIFLLIVVVVAVVGVGFGIVILAPRIGRLLDNSNGDDSPELASKEDANGELNPGE
jgi:hypothetical protein